MHCVNCQSLVTYKSGIICTNYGHNRGRFQKCRKAYCKKCFTSHELDAGKAAVPLDFNGTSLAEVEDKICYQEAQSGNHLCTTFQCPNCQSQNIRGLNLCQDDPEDATFEVACIGVTPDAFWSHSSKTVSGHVSEVNFIVKYANMLGMQNPLPQLDLFPLGHHLGMLQAIMVIMRSMEPGRGKNGKVKYETFRKMKSTYTVLWNVSLESGTDIALSTSNKKGQNIGTCNPSEGGWYQMFDSGC